MIPQNGISEQTFLGFFGHHKCGSTWVSHVLRSIATRLGLEHFHAHGAYEFDRDLKAVHRAQGFDLITYVNANFLYVRDLSVRGIHVVRDPRDLIVSAYYSHLHSHPTDGWPELEEIRRHLQQVPLETGLLLELEFCSGVMSNILSWPAEAEGILLIRFEELIENNLDGFRRMVDFLGLLDRLGPEALTAIVDEWSFKQLSGGRDPGETNNRHHYRKGIAGEWKAHFSPAVCWAFKKRYNEILVRFGYESNDQWAA
jgi:hypothetical protein